jgi:hypothetical protein
MIRRGRDVPTIIKGEVEYGAFSGDTNNNSTSAFDHESVAVRGGVCFTTRNVVSEHVTVQKDVRW